LHSRRTHGANAALIAAATGQMGLQFFHLTLVPYSTTVAGSGTGKYRFLRNAEEQAQPMEAAMPAILLNTPWWVFALFAGLLVLGMQGLQPRVVPLWRLLVTPAVFIAWGLGSLALQLTVSSPLFLLDWLIAAAIGGALAWLTVRPEQMRREPAGVALPGSGLPLMRNMLIFAAKYGLAVAAVLDPAQREQFALWDVAVSGASAGYFLGWLVVLARAYRRTPRPDLVADPQ
jgi:hypothetical protein